MATVSAGNTAGRHRQRQGRVGGRKGKRFSKGNSSSFAHVGRVTITNSLRLRLNEAKPSLSRVSWNGRDDPGC